MISRNIAELAYVHVYIVYSYTFVFSYVFIYTVYVCRQGSHLRPQHPGHQWQPCGRQERHEHHPALPAPPPLPGMCILAISVYILYNCILVVKFYVQ